MESPLLKASGSSRKRARHGDTDLVNLVPHRSPAGAQVVFSGTTGFSLDWWAGTTQRRTIWYSFVDSDRGEEVARAKLLHGSGVGVAYPTYTVPSGGATQIDLLQVRTDLQHTGLGIGPLAVSLIREHEAGPFVALSKGPEVDGFWRHIGWTEHHHEERPVQEAAEAMLPMQPFCID